MYDLIIVGCGATGSILTSLVTQYAISERKIKSVLLIDGDMV